MQIGIISIYYKNSNYGGNLQAYGLTKYLRQCGYDAEQICYSLYRPELFSAGFWHLSHIKRLKSVARKILNSVCHTGRKLRMACLQHFKAVKRDKHIYNFNSKQIPHSKTIYYAHDYPAMAEEYDVFISSFTFMNTHMDKIPQANKDAYACRQIIWHIVGAVRNFGCFREFLQYIRAEMTPELHAIIDRCQISHLQLKQRILFTLLKRYCFWGFWLIYRRNLRAKKR